MTYFSVDIEADGPIPGDYSMIQLGACLVSNPDIGFCQELKPISPDYNPESLAISGFTREQCHKFKHPKTVMQDFKEWVKANTAENTQPIFIADNNGFDWMFVAWYFHHFLNENPFGWSSRNLNDVFHGIKLDMRASFKHLRPTAHTHNALDDARANAGAMLVIIEKYKLKVKL